MSLLTKNVSRLIEKESLVKKLNGDKKLTIKLGADPTRPDLHLGHAVVLKKMRELQELGHKIVFLIGDYTTKIGDPSGRNSARPILSDEEIEKNSATYFEQVGKILDVSKIEIRKNSEWFERMSFAEILTLCGKVTVSQVLERDDFKKRIENNFDVGIHEIMYPIMQGYDSVVLKADVEIGGDDQLLNMLMGRDLQKKLGQEPQDIIACPLLVGTDGVKKMSKSLGNYIGLNDSADEMFGKTMSIPDSALKQYLDLAGEFTEDELSSLYSKLDSGENPKLIKENLAINIIDQYHPIGSGARAKENFDKIFVNKEVPENIPEIDLSWLKTDIVSVLVELGFSSSRSEALRILEQGGVSINSKKVESADDEVKKGDVIKAGKRRFAKVL